MVKPEEYDVVRLLRSLPEQNLLAGSIGTVVIDHAKYANENGPAAYLVEFADSDGVTQSMATIRQSDLQVVERPKA